MAFDPHKVTFFAQTDARGKNVKFGIKARDRQRHVYVIGKTGMGKSTLLENMAVQDIQNGEGMAFIDPHGAAAETLLSYIPEHRINDVLYFAPFDTENPVAFNIMEDVGADKRHLVVSGLMSVFKKIWVDAWSARMEYILANTLLALLEYPGSTLLGVNRMLSDKDYRKLVVDNVQDPGVKAFWVDEFAKYNERYMQEAGDAIKNKIGQFTSNPIIRNIVGQAKSSFDIRKMMDEKKILIINLSKGLIGETNANLLGSMLTTRIYLAAMSRADLSPEKMKEMPNFYFYVDEFQSFANATFANILSEARKYHLNLTIAHQYIEQMEEEVRNAVFGNVGTIISFRVGPFDAEVLETIFTPQFLATDIVNLSFAQIYLTLMIDGIGSQPFSATTLPPIEAPQVSCKDMAIAASRKQFTVDRASVEVGIQKFHERVVIPKVTEKPKFPDRSDRPGEGERKPEQKEREARSVSPRPAERIVHEVKPEVRASAPSSQIPHRRSTDIVKTESPIQKSEVVEPVVHDAPLNQVPEEKVAIPPSVPVSAPVATPVPIVQKQENKTEALRAILERIAKPQDEKKEHRDGEKKNLKRDESSKGKLELKQLLQTVLKKEEQAVSAPSLKEEVPLEVSPSRAPHSASEISERKTSREKPEPHVKNTHHTITPKELERMMRVTTSDTPPH